jgi:hypothetical protein
VASTRSRPRGREHARPFTGGAVADHVTMIYSIAIISIVVIIAFLALTSTGHVIDAATQHFMLFYAGVFALIALCASVGLGLVATDRRFLHAGHRVSVQAAHRAASFGAVTFLIIHIVTEILAQRVHVLDAVIPFLSPFRTFYIGLGTIASDLIILLVITGIMRGRFNASGKAWRWRSIHYTSYASFVFGIWHGLLAGRPAKPYVDWSYGFLIALVLLGLAVRVLSNSLKPKESLSAPPVQLSGNSASAPFRAAAMFAQLGASRGGRYGGGPRASTQPLLSAPVPAPVLTASPGGPVRASTAPAGPVPAGTGQPYYEPGYEGPPRYLGAPRARGGTGPMPRAASGPMPRAASGPMPRAASGPMPRAATGPMPMTGANPRPSSVSGPMPRAATGPIPRTRTGPIPRTDTGPIPRGASGPFPRRAGPFPGAATGPRPWPGPGPEPRAATGPMPQAGQGRPPGWDAGPRFQPPTGPRPSAPTGDLPRAATGPMAGGNSSRPRPATGPMPQYGGVMPSAGGVMPSAGGGMPPSARRDGSGGGQPGQPGQPGRPGAGQGGGGWYPAEPEWDGLLLERDPDLRYREPGPGMPGYRGSRDHRYGGDKR